MRNLFLVDIYLDYTGREAGSGVIRRTTTNGDFAALLGIMLAPMTWGPVADSD